ncbi:MAG TPA: hypothetical protein VM843_05490 [Flavisolibacter sp.]|jgi:hypothetical protein|nr:hypothetical protein [Flavisolibacter sp.]
MKQIITLLLCAGSFASAQAQTSAEESRDIILGKKTGPGSTQNDRSSKDVILGRNDGRVYRENGTRTSYPSGSNAQQREAVNREYDRKVESIRNNRTLSAAEKERTIRQLNKDRAERLRALNAQRDNRRYDDGDERAWENKTYKKSKKSRSNNGNHYGWEKGKGNKKTGDHSRRYDD